MSNINSEFDNLGSVSDVKDFDQSKLIEPGVLDVPDVYQEFDDIEHEVERQVHSLNEVTLFSDNLAEARVVRREDVLALESLVGTLENLPHINSYTNDYSLVNYNVTQESVGKSVLKFVVKLAKQIWEYISNAFHFIRTQITNALKRNAYVDDPSKQDDVKENVKTAETKVKDAPGTVNANKSTNDDNKNAARIVRVNKRLRALLYPKFTELGVLSLGGDININLLVDEMCEQRLKPFYSTFFKSVYERDIVLKNTVAFLTRRINTDFILLVNRTAELFEQDISQEPSVRYVKIYDMVPEQLSDYIAHYGNGKSLKGGSTDLYRASIDDAYDIAKSITSISVTHELPEPRAILKLDLDWLGELFNERLVVLGKDIEAQFNHMKKNYKVIERNSDNIHISVQKDLMALYSDWIVINKMATMLAVFRARTDAIYNNVDILSKLIIEVSNIITE